MITLSKVPNKLRGDLTKWYSEIQTGVFVGNVSARIRDLLWTRILENIGNGEATMVFNANNELGYQFKTTRADHVVVDYDGLPLMMRVHVANRDVASGFSNAAKHRQARRFINPQQHHNEEPASKAAIAAIDLETTGTDATRDSIIAIGAVKQEANGQTDSFYRLLQTSATVSQEITDLTGLTNRQLETEGVALEVGLAEVAGFIGLLPVVGYNLHFDMAFIARAQQQLAMSEWQNKLIDLMPRVKKANPFLDNYKLGTVLSAYDISNNHPHNALSDAEATLQLANKVIKTL